MIQRLLPRFLRELEDPRYFQILYLGSFLTYGIGYLGWSSQLNYYLSVFVSALVTQLAFSLYHKVGLGSLKSGLITALGLCILLHSTSIYVGALAGFLGIASKFLIRSKGKHIFNPANFAIIGSILLTQQAWVSPGQWGSSALLWFMIGAGGLMMILRVGRLDTSLAFLGSFAALLFIYNVMYLGWEMDVWLHKLSNGTLLLFTFFMITDPKTTPNHPKARIIWAASLGVALFLVSSFMYVQTAAVWLLFMISPFTPLFDRYFKAERFQWNTNNKTYENNTYTHISAGNNER